MSEKLLPCPFCGEEARMSMPSDKVYIVHCRKCLCSSPAKLDEQEAIEAWNRRSAPTPDAGMVEVMDKLAKVEIPVIIDPGEAKWFYLGLAQGMRSMARAALAALRGKEGGGE